jgi:SAM-dependent methyltransferase
LPSCSLAENDGACHHDDVTESIVRYDEIGRNYATARHADPRISALIGEALDDSSSVVNVGAGTGSYEPSDRRVVAVEPSNVMISQRRSAVPVIQAIAERLPFRDGTFDAAMAILTMHHWSDPGQGLTELRRVGRRGVILTIDPEFARSFWLTAEYFPGIGEWDAAHFMNIHAVCAALGKTTIVPVLIPHDCQDGFLAAYWRRPVSYLDPAVRAGISTFAMLDEREERAGLRRLAHDLETGAWRDRHRSLRELETIDAGYRLVVAT